MRLILDFINAIVGAEKKKQARLPYGMFLSRVFNKAQLSLAGERSDNKKPTTTMKTFQALDLKP